MIGDQSGQSDYHLVFPEIEIVIFNHGDFRWMDMNIKQSGSLYPTSN